MTGTIRTLRVDKGFGFIKDSSGNEYFFHQSAVYGESIDNLREGDRLIGVSVTTGLALARGGDPDTLAGGRGLGEAFGAEGDAPGRGCFPAGRGAGALAPGPCRRPAPGARVRRSGRRRARSRAARGLVAARVNGGMTGRAKAYANGVGLGGDGDGGVLPARAARDRHATG